LAFSGNGGFFPLAKGMSWTYEGNERSTIIGGNQVQSDHFIKEMRVVRSVTRGGTTSALVSGFPSEFSVITENEHGLFFYRDVADKKTGEIILEKAVSGEDLGKQILRFPVRLGDRVGQDPPRPDSRYCWSVARRIQSRYGPAWEVVYSTLPDDEIFDLAPGVGIVRYEYQHHGTVMETHAHLASFHVPSTH
jgi:hypothetical protein